MESYRAALVTASLRFLNHIGQFGGTQEAESKFSLVGRRLGAACASQRLSWLTQISEEVLVRTDPSYIQGEGSCAEPASNPYSP